jgi:imidazolonepropionase-like amidohydrolase
MPDTIVIHAGSLLDVATGDLLSDRRILVVDGRIEAILAADTPVPDDAQPIDLTRRTVLPDRRFARRRASRRG